MKDLSDFAGVERPLHPSALKTLVLCPWRAVLIHLSDSDEPGGAAADTGSACHRAAEELHKGAEPAACIEAMAGDLPSYPAADLREAAGLFLRYAADQRTLTEEVVAVELSIRFSITPTPEDPTGAPIVIIGTADQVRRGSDGKLYLWDIKTSKKNPVTVLRNSQHQAAAYCIGASFALGEQVNPGGLIMPRAPVMYVPFSWTWDDIQYILEPVRHTVANIRAGRVWHVPNADSCDWCPASGPELCLPRMRRTLYPLPQLQS